MMTECSVSIIQFPNWQNNHQLLNEQIMSLKYFPNCCTLQFLCRMFPSAIAFWHVLNRLHFMSPGDLMENFAWFLLIFACIKNFSLVMLIVFCRLFPCVSAF